MTLIAGIGFASPWLLLGLAALPLLWILLRAVPPAPRKQIFPAVTLLLGLSDKDSQSDRTPWWLLLLRLLAVAAAILGFAGPVLNPSREITGSGPLLLVLDGSWAGASNWSATREQISLRLDEAGRADRPVALLQLTTPKPLQFQAASSWQQQLPGLMPQPWQPGPDQITEALEQLAASNGGFDTLWFSDGLAYEGQSALSAALTPHGEVTVVSSGLPVLGLQPPVAKDGALEISVLRSQTDGTAAAPREVLVQARGRDPGGTQRSLAQVTASFDPDALTATVLLSLPAELRARIDRFELADQRSAGAVALSDDSLRRREVALIASGAADEGLALLSPLHYLRQALKPTADLIEGSLSDILPANPDVIVLADVARLSPDVEEALATWVEAGGLLLRFAGPRLASSDTARDSEERLMPVRLRIGGRSIGGAMSWGEPKTLAPFAEGSPFLGLTIPAEVSVTSQVVAQPDPSLADRVIAALDDGTPLVTRKPLGQGQV
ncbi:BatA domain-containing protein, partial [Pseudophaeobacter sp.]|uniref:BatA domain-containing protein n=1 Tax=Pseudophaeobacter sp. TaxID=1971739 RepID=UPI003299A527